MKYLYIFIFSALIFATTAFAQNYEVPEFLYYKFNETGMTSTQNLANPGVGDPSAALNGTISMGGVGQFDAGLIAAGGLSSTNYVNTGWATSLSGDWTISFWVSGMPTGLTTLYYVFGDNTASSFRCFFNGVAGTNNVALRGTGMTDVIVPGVAPGPSVVHFVYVSAIPEVRGYLNGTLVVTVAQPVLSFSGTGPFKVAGYSTSNALPAGAMFDEFRFYNRALDDVEIANTWDHSLPYLVPVELTSFTGTQNGNTVSLTWTTATETNNSGFAVERSTNNSEFSQIGFVQGFGSTTEPQSYSFSDKDLKAGTYYYRLKQVDYDGSYEYSNVVEVGVKGPAKFALKQNYPNPFNPSTKISFELARDSHVLLTIYNALGQEVKQLVNDNLTSGIHEVDFSAEGLQSGVYFYKIQAGNFVSIKKMMLLK